MYKISGILLTASRQAAAFSEAEECLLRFVCIEMETKSIASVTSMVFGGPSL